MLKEVKLENLPDLTIIVGNHAVTLRELIVNAAELSETDRIIVLMDDKENKTKDHANPHNSTTEEKVLKAWNRGEKTIKQVMEITGFSYPTVRRYIPVTPEG